MSEFTCLLGEPALSDFRKRKLVRRISDLGATTLPIYKVRQFACRSLRGKGGRTGLRLTYAWDAGSDAITLIEIYIKSDKDNEDRARILSHFSGSDA